MQSAAARAVKILQMLSVKMVEVVAAAEKMAPEDQLHPIKATQEETRPLGIQAAAVLARLVEQEPQRQQAAQEARGWRIPSPGQV